MGIRGYLYRGYRDEYVGTAKKKFKYASSKMIVGGYPSLCIIQGYLCEKTFTVGSVWLLHCMSWDGQRRSLAWRVWYHGH